MNGSILQTVIETPEFISQSKAVMSSDARLELISYIARNPLAGEIIIGTGGARKLRWYADNHSGKRGGVRVIYYFYDDMMPIYLFTVYKKNQRDNITAADKRILYKVIKLIVNEYKEHIT